MIPNAHTRVNPSALATAGVVVGLIVALCGGFGIFGFGSMQVLNGK